MSLSESTEAEDYKGTSMVGGGEFRTSASRTSWPSRPVTPPPSHMRYTVAPATGFMVLACELRVQG